MFINKISHYIAIRKIETSIWFSIVQVNELKTKKIQAID